MQALNRPALARKTQAELVHILRRMGADSQGTESKESLITRILMFAPPEQPPQTPPRRPAPPPLSQDAIEDLLAYYIARGMEVTLADGCWEFTFEGRRDSGTLAQPAWAIRRCAEALLRISA